MFDAIEKKVEELKPILEKNGYEYDYYTVADIFTRSIYDPIVIRLITKDKKIFEYKGGETLISTDGKEILS